MRIGIFSLIAWDFIQQRPHKFAEELAALGHDVVYVEPPDLTGSRAARIARTAHLRLAPREVAPGIAVVRPQVVPPFRAYAHLLPLNRFLQPLAARQLRALRLDFAVVLATEYGPVVRALGIPFAYDHVDDTHLMEHVLTEQFVADMDLLRRDGAFTIYIQEAEARRDPKGVFSPNGADLDQFRVLDVEKLFDAVVLSNIAKWFDMDAILGSRKRILLIGPMDVDGGDNRRRYFEADRPNLLWIPQVDKEVANQWLSRAEVGLVPFRHTHPVLRYAMPIKILEYFLAELPVVTYRNEGIAEMYGDMVTFYANDGSDLPLDDAIDAAKAKRDRDYRAFAERYQWADIVAELEGHIVRATGLPRAEPRRTSGAPRPLPRLLPSDALRDLTPAPSEPGPRADVRIVCWGLTDWEAPRQRPQHLADELSRRYSVLYVRPVPLSRFVRQRGRPLAPAVERVNDHLTVLRPRALSPGRYGAVARFNHQRAAALIRERLDPSRPAVLWLSHPDQAAQIGQFGEALVCFDLMDDHPAFKAGPGRAAMDLAQQALLRRADLVFASSAALLERAEAAGARAILVPNAVELERFAAAATRSLVVPLEIARLPSPRLLFYGTLGPWVDTGWIAEVARRRPDWTVVIVGPEAGADPAPLAGLPNVRGLGWKPYETLPAYLQHVDVCLLPFVDDDLTRAVDPVKLYEYLAAGKPVVATPLPELAKCGDLVDVAATPDAAVAAIERHLATPEDDARRQARLAFAAEHTWRARGEAVAAAIEAALAERRGTPRANDSGGHGSRPESALTVADVASER